MTIVYEGLLSTGQTAFDTDIRDLCLVTDTSGTYLVAANGANGGLTVYEVHGNGQVTLSDTQAFANPSIDDAFGALTIADIGGDTMVITGDTGSGAFLGCEIQTNGGIGTQESINLPGTGADVAGSVVLPGTGSTDIVVTINRSNGTLTSYFSSPGSGLQQQSSKTTSLDAESGLVMDTCVVGNSAFVLIADTSVQGVTSYKINQSTGTIQQKDQYGQDQGLGVAMPTDLASVDAHGQTWVILAAEKSSSLSVMSMDANGNLTLADHSTDTLNTRFGQTQSLSVFEADGQAFVLAGGSDGGMSLFALSPDGHLIFTETIVHETGFGLQDITDIETVVAGDIVQVFVSSESAAGLSQFSISLEDLGSSLSGAGTLNGTGMDDMLSGTGTGNDRLDGKGGDDILIAGNADTTLIGGTGADTFVLRPSPATYVIEDFKAGVDRLDLSLFPMLRSPIQLDFTSTGAGARIDYGDTVIVIKSHNGETLTEAQIWPGGFDWADRHHFDGATQPPWPPGNPSDPPTSLPVKPPNPPPAPTPLETPAAPDIDVTHSGSNAAEVVKGAKLVDDPMFLYGGADDVWDKGADNYINGGGGDDTLAANGGSDTIIGGDGADSISGNAGDDHLIGDAGQDTIWGGDGNDYMFGGSQRDSLGGADGNDTMLGGNDKDTVYGGDGNDLGTGDLGDDKLWMGNDRDTAYGGDGQDSLGGGDGNDLLHGEAGDDLIFGGNQGDTMFGGGGADVMWAGPGNDMVVGNTGNDTMGGGDHDDSLWGGSGNDQVWGGKGDDFLFGEEGDDTLDGEAGYDCFVFAEDHGNDVINRYSLDDDYICIDIDGLTFGDITLLNRNGNTLIKTTEGEIELVGIAPGSVTEEDFVFF